MLWGIKGLTSKQKERMDVHQEKNDLSQQDRCVRKKITKLGGDKFDFYLTGEETSEKERRKKLGRGVSGSLIKNWSDVFVG